MRVKVVIACVAALGASIAFIAAAPAATTSGAAPRLLTSVNVVAGKPSEFKFKLSKTSVPHGVVRFNIANQGLLPHTFKVCSAPNRPLVDTCNGTGSQMLSPGSGTSMSVTLLRTGSYEYLCTVPGHAAAGMKGILKVT
jgi:plastocyanin